MNSGELRLFIAVGLPERLRQALGREIDRLAALAPAKSVRWLRPAGIHLTLKFLGECAAARVPEIAAVMGEAAIGQGPLHFTVGGLGFFPNAKSPRVIWTGLREPSGKLAVLQRRLEEGTAGLGFKPEDRGFNPHLTLGRTTRGIAPAQLRALTEALAQETIPVLGEVEALAITLFQSELAPGGAIYTPLIEMPLAGASSSVTP